MVLATRIDIIVIAFYMLLLVVVGVLLSYFNKNASDFFKSSSKMPWWLAGASLFMSSFSVWTFTGAAGVAYRAPGAAFAMYLSTAAGMIFGVLFLAGLWRRTRARTILSYLSERYGVSTNQTYSWTLTTAQLVQAGIQLLALGKFISVALGTGLEATVIVCGAVIAVYCLIGGLWAVAVTDTLQCIVLVSCALVVMVLGLAEAGGPGAVLAALPEGHWEVTTQEFDWFYVVAFGTMMVFAMNSGVLSQRYFSVKDEREARKVALLTMVLLAAAPFIWFLPPIFAKVQGLDLGALTLGLAAPEEASYVAYSLHILPQGAIGVMLAAMLAATMSSLSSVFNAYAGVITEDIVQQIFWKDASPRALLLVGRLITLVFGALVVLVALKLAGNPGGVFQMMMNYSGVVIIPSGIPIVIGLFYRRTPWWSGILSFLGGVALGIFLLGSDYRISFTTQVFAIGGFSAALYFVPGLFAGPRGTYRARLDEFFRRQATPVTADEVGDTGATDLGSLRITGWATVLMGAAAGLLMLLDIPAGARLANGAVGAVIAAFGVLMLLAGRHLRNKHAAAGR